MLLLCYRKVRQLIRNLNDRLCWPSQVERFIQWTLLHAKDGPAAESKHWSVIDLVLLYGTILQPIIVLLNPLDPLYRILLFDTTFCMGIPQYHNWLCMLFCLNCLYIRWRLFHHHPYAMMQLIRVVRRGSVCSFFLRQHMSNQGSVCLVTRVILHYGQMWIHFVRQCYTVIASYAIYLAAISAFTLYRDYAECCFPTWLGCLYLIGTAVNCAVFCLVLFMFAHVHLLLGQMMVLFTLIFFLKLRQENELLNLPGQKRLTTSGLTTCTLYRFMRAHTQTLVMIFQCNRFYGNLLLAFIVLNVPQNTFIFSSIVLNRFQYPFVKFAYGDYFLGQVVVIAIFHLLAAAYSSRIHRCAKLLAIASAQRILSHSPIRAQIALSLYYHKFSCKKKYGITYGSFGLISFASFAKFLLLYGECMMKWFVYR